MKKLLLTAFSKQRHIDTKKSIIFLCHCVFVLYYLLLAAKKSDNFRS
jgi:hypothetical protein